ncbi:MAG: anti-sigma factor [Acidobacteriota bacterium]
MTVEDDRRLDDLLIEQATAGLDDVSGADLKKRLASRPDIDPEAYELAVAAVTLAYLRVEEPMPESVRETLRHMAPEQRSDFPEPIPHPSAFSPPSKREGRDLGYWSGWIAAAAASVVAAIGWWPSAEVTPIAPTTSNATVVAASAPPTAADLRSTRLANDPNVPRADWQVPEGAQVIEIRGDVVWDPEAQVGWLRFTGLPTNDPEIEQYQLWIFDGERDERYPVDGGVFDIASDGEAVIAIDAKLLVSSATLFAVTVESPGGVVVSDRSRIVALASLDS